MRTKFIFTLFIVFLQCFVHAETIGYYLQGLYAWWDGKPEAWVIVYDKTNKSLEKISSKDPLFFYEDVVASWAFLENKWCLTRFIKSDNFKKNKEAYEIWLKNIFRFVYQVAEFVADKKFSWKDKYETLLRDVADIETLCKNKDFELYNKKIRKVLMDALFPAEPQLKPSEPQLKRRRP